MGWSLNGPLLHLVLVASLHFLALIRAFTFWGQPSLYLALALLKSWPDLLFCFLHIFIQLPILGKAVLHFPFLPVNISFF